MSSPVKEDNSEETVLLKQKKMELESLFSEIKEIEAKTPMKKREPIFNNKYERGNNESMADFIRIESQLQTALAQIDYYKEDNSNLQELLNQKDESIEELEATISAKNDRIRNLEQMDEIHMKNKLVLEEEIAKQQSHKQKQDTIIRNLQLDAARRVAQGSGTGEQYFHHLTNLENELKEKDDIISQLFEEKKTLENMLRLQEVAVSQLTMQLEESTKANVDIKVVENKLRALAHQLEDLESENKVLRHVHRVKTEAIERLTKELEVRGHTEEFVSQLKNEVTNRDVVIQQLHYENDHLLREKLKLETELNSFHQVEDTPVTMSDWFEERRVLKSEISRLQSKKASQTREIETYHRRNQQLQAKLATITQSLRDQQNLPARYDSVLAETDSSSADLDLTNGMVALELFNVVERNLNVQRAKVVELQDALLERQDVIESAQKRLEVAGKAKATEAKKARRVEQDYQAEIATLKKENADLKAEFEKEVKRLNAANANTRKTFERALRNSTGGNSTPRTPTAGSTTPRPSTPRSTKPRSP
eukprot:GCRY01004229.1.p1 GENE.GCRY01004229.1~~GCRY01004229.1.p1  ORF type:complete len:537 (+),score=206.10 GCRY01004229.1:140-1750(+)